MKNIYKIFFLLLSSIIVTNLSAQNAGDLDESYGDGGTVISNLGDAYDFCFGMIVQPDQKIVIAGQATVNAQLTPTLVRLNSDGTTDMDFGTDGVAISDVFYGSSLSSQIDPLAIQPDGKLLYTFNTGLFGSFDIAVTRFNTDGSIDTNFGENGTAIDTSVPTDYYPHSLLVQSDGKILVVGQTISGMTATRFTSAGFIDESFADNGLFTLDIGEGDDRIMNAKQQSDGKIVLVGNGVFNGDPTNGSRYEVVRLNEDGSLDESFSDDGIWAEPISVGYDYAFSMALRDDGTILVVGNKQNGGDTDVAMLALTPDGVLDTTFGTDGITVTDMSGSEVYPRSILIAPDGKILVSGSNWTSLIYAFVFRYDANGILDTSFSDDGQVYVSDYVYVGEGLALQADGKIVINGWVGYSGTNDHDYITSRLLYDDAVAVKDIESRPNTIAIFPNPANDKINLQWKNNTFNQQVNISITDINGKIVWQSQPTSFNQTQIDTALLPQGVYSISIKGKKTNDISKFVIAR